MSLRNTLGYVREVARFSAAAASYLRHGTTPPSGYQTMIRMHCRTQGRFTDFAHRVVALRRPPYALPPATGVLGQLTPAQVAGYARQLNDQGYVVFEQKLPAATVEQLRQLALTIPSRPCPPPAGMAAEGVVYDPARPVAPLYRFAESRLVQEPVIQALMADASLLALAQAYLGSQPLLDVVALWWSTSFSKEPDAEGAQLFHFDMDRLKWLKFFFYLSDVTTDTGPHVFVRRSHRSGQPAALLQRGYQRIPDADMQAHYAAEDFIEFTGPRGTIVAEDTRGFHKGKPLRHGERLMFQLQFSDSLFGGTYASTPLALAADAPLQQVRARYPRVMAKFPAP